MAKKTARILRTIPIEGIIYKANDLVTLDDKLLAKLDSTAYDTSKAALGYCKSIGITAVEHASTTEPETPPEGGQQGGEGGLAKDGSGKTEGDQGEGELTE